MKRRFNNKPYWYKCPGCSDYKMSEVPTTFQHVCEKNPTKKGNPRLTQYQEVTSLRQPAPK